MIDRRRRSSGESVGSASDAELDLEGDIAAANPNKPDITPVPEQLISQIGAILFALTMESADPRARRPSRDGIGLLTSAISPGARRRNLSSASQPTVMVGRMAQYLNAQALIIGIVYLARFLGVMLKSDSGSVPNMTAEQILIWYVTAAVLADKFTNDDTYDDILPAMGVVSQLKVESLRIEESQMLASILCHATMFVTPTEFHNLLTAVQQRSWARMDRPAVLLVVKDVLSGEASATQPPPNAATPS